MADKGNTSSYTGRLKDKIKENEKKINELEKEKEKLQEQLRDYDENSQPKDNELKEEIARLKEENKTLKTDVRDLKESNAFLENEMESMKQTNGDLKKELGSTIKQLKERDEKLKTFELSEDELVIKELCSSVQQDILKIVLQEYFDEIMNKSIRYMEQYISTQIEDEDQQDEARGRWKKLKREIEWDDFLIKQLKPVKQSGIGATHPHLTEERIEEAKMSLNEMKKLSRNMLEAVDKLQNIWKQTKSKLLQKGPRTRSAEGRDRVGRLPRSLSKSAKGQDQEVSTSTAAGGGYDIPTKE